MYAGESGSDSASGYQILGTYTVIANGPTSDSVTPASGTGSNQVFTAVYSDSAGAAALTNLQFMVNSSFSGIPRCWVMATPAGIFLANDAANAWTGPGTTTLSNSQCSLDAAGSSLVRSGNTATVTLSLSFTAAFAGLKTVYMLAGESASAANWTAPGTFNVTAPQQRGQAPFVLIDAPATGASVTGTVTVSGWVIESLAGIGNGIGSVKVSVDSLPAVNAVYGVARPDVCGVYPNRVGCPNVGFTYQLNTAALTQGSHTITVSATDTATPPVTGSSSTNGLQLSIEHDQSNPRLAHHWVESERCQHSSVGGRVERADYRFEFAGSGCVYRLPGGRIGGERDGECVGLGVK